MVASLHTADSKQHASIAALQHITQKDEEGELITRRYLNQQTWKATELENGTEVFESCDHRGHLRGHNFEKIPNRAPWSHNVTELSNQPLWIASVQHEDGTLHSFRYGDVSPVGCMQQEKGPISCGNACRTAPAVFNQSVQLTLGTCP